MKRYFLAIICLFLLLPLYGQNPKPDISQPCSIYQGFNFQPDNQETVGHVTHMRIGAGDSLIADFSVVDPMNYPNEVDVVGVMSSFNWAGGYADPINLNCNVSVTNKNTVLTFILLEPSSIDVEFDFNVYTYDPESKEFYKQILSGIHGNLQGLIHKEGSDLMLYIDDDPNTEVQVPLNYAMSISIDPQDIWQGLNFNVSSEDPPFPMQWGYGIPTAPGLVSPISGSSTPDLTPTFDWTDTPGADTYTLVIDNDPGFGSPEIDTSPANCTYTPSSDMAGGLYCWKVRTNNFHGSSDFSDVWNFTIELPPPGTPIFVDPPLNGTNLTWGAVSGATGYDIYSCTEPYGEYTFEAHVTTNEYDISGTLSTENMKYYYVVATN